MPDLRRPRPKPIRNMTARAAAEALLEHGHRFDRLDAGLAAIPGRLKPFEGQVVMVKCITGAILAGMLALILRAFVQG